MKPGPGKKTWQRFALTAALIAGSFAAPLAGSFASVSAQTPVNPANPPQDTAPKTPAQRILEKVRGLRPIGAPDSVPNGDSLRAQPQQVRVNGMGAMGGFPGAGAAGGIGGRNNGTQTQAAIDRDSIWLALLKLNGFNATEYKGDTAFFRADSSNLQLRGNALVSRNGQQMEAGRITYTDSITLACGFDKPRVSGMGTDTPLESDSLCYDIANRTGVARGATTTISEGAGHWRMYTTTLVTHADTTYGGGAIFTDCDMPWSDLHYAFNAKRVKVIRNNTLIARDVTLRFKDVPVFWLPFMVQSLSQGRRSGILMPRFGVNDIARTSTRYSRRIEDVGFYWAISDFMGAELAMDWMSDNWTALRGSYDYNFLKQFVRGGVTVRRFWKDDGGKELTIASQNSWEPNERTRLSGNVNFASSSSFIRNRTFDPRELNRSIDSNFSMNRRFNFGSMTLGSTRRQFLTDNTVNQVLPNVSFSLSPVTLFEALPGEEHWYSNATWTGSVETRREANLVDTLTSTNPSAQTRHQNQSSLRSTFQLGQLGISQNFSRDDQTTNERHIPTESGDSVITLPSAQQARNAWDVGINFQKRLIGTTTFTPGLRLGGEQVSNEKTANKLVSSPVRLNLDAAIHADAYGMFGIGVGPFEKFRHKFSPTLAYTYSPKPQADSIQKAVFSSLGSTNETNRLTITLAQTFEAKYRERRDDAQIRADSAQADTASGPKRSQAARTLMLLSINTSAVAYDFVQAREFGDGIVAPELTNTFQSGLLSNFSLDIAHELFRTNLPADGSPATVRDRSFAPHLSRVNANLNFSGSSWLFRVLRLGRRDSMPVRPGEVGSNPTQPAEGGVPADRTQNEFGLVGTRNRYAQTPSSGSVGAWTATMTYALVRPRTVENAVPENSLYQLSNNDQTVRGTFNFQPTENWSARWETGYSFTRSSFNDHILSLTRRLHDWDATFDFIKSQNGNFSFQFRVNLRANPDIKLDWSQNDRSNATLPGSRF